MALPGTQAINTGYTPPAPSSMGLPASYGSGNSGGAAFGYDPTNYVQTATGMGYDELTKGQGQWNSLAGANANNMRTAQGVSNQAGSVGSAFSGQAKHLMNVYNNRYMPAQMQALNTARTWASPGQLALNRTGAISGVEQGVNAGMDNATALLRSYNIDPSAGRYAGQVRAGEVAGGAAAGAAGTQSDINTRLQQQQLLNAAINTGQQTAGLGSTAAGVGLAAGAEQVNPLLQATQTQASTMGTPVNWYGLSGPEFAQWNQAETTAGQFGQQQQQLQLEQQKLQQEAGSAGITGALGGLGVLNGMMGSGGAFGGGPFGGGALSGLGSSFAGLFGGGAGAAGGSSIASLAALPAAFVAHSGGKIPGYADGGMEDSAINTGPPGAVVPTSASPSGGAVQDDVNAKVGPGEFIWPKDVVAWRGEAWMQKEIQKARDERVEKTVAKPTLSRLPPTQQGGPPRFVSPSQRAA